MLYLLFRYIKNKYCKHYSNMIKITVACFYPHSDSYGAPTAPLVQEQASSGSAVCIVRAYPLSTEVMLKQVSSAEYVLK